MNCPRCNICLTQTVYENVEIDKCPRCNGVWLDDGEILKIIQTEEETFPPELIRETLALGFAGVPKDEQQTSISCPKCKSGMPSINYDYSSGIILDRCPQGHGVWLDGKELEKVQIVREQSEKDFQANQESWLALVRLSLDDKKMIADESRQKNMRPTKYLANCLIRKLIGY